ncbi:MAG: EAL domain-containing protein [Oceanospirillaceae bacterium]|nr:EAL domain-containing protein [Oceanospirillaceae bacterium]MCP5334438.1 EAL domain-containing protein [Oceanospirillaceae bacterium]MCP5350679.1 EAL domain-containing protein [Oceanospirillaceae bacterium]
MSILFWPTLIRGALFAIALLYFLRAPRWRHIRASKAYFFIVLALLMAIAAHGFALFDQHPSGQGGYWVREGILTLSVLVFLLSMALGVHLSDQAVNQQRQMGQRQQWLQSIYDLTPVAVAVFEADGEISYSNAMFRQLQTRYMQDNPFADFLRSAASGREVILLDPAGNSAAFWAALHPMTDENARILIVTDVSRISEHNRLLKVLARHLQTAPDQFFNKALLTLQQSLHASLVYVAAYDRQHASLKKVATSGDIPVPDVLPYQWPSDLLPNSPAWQSLEGAALQQSADPLVRLANPRQTLSISLFDHAGSPIGGIVLLFAHDNPVEANLMDFLQVFANRVSTELEHFQQQSVLRDNQERYQAFIRQNRDAIARIDVQPPMDVRLSQPNQWQHIQRHGQLSEANQAFMALLASADATLEDVLANPALAQLIRYALECGYTVDRLETMLNTPDGQQIWVSCSVSSVVRDGQLSRIWLTGTDITESKLHIQNLEHQASHDALTGLPNRVALRSLLDDTLEQAKSYGQTVAMLLIDLDRFKEINDTLGHHYGDVLLKKIGPRLRPLLLENRARLARLGGDEFAVIMPSLGQREDARQLARKIVQAIREPFDLGSMPVEIAASVGISIFPEHGQDTSTLLRCADVAMYRAKNVPEGVLFYATEQDEHSPRRLALMTALNHAVRGEQFFLCYQPKIHLGRQQLDGLEALIRWQHPDFGPVSPGEFIHLAEMTDLIVPITHWVLEEAISQLNRWNAQGLQYKVAVNVSARNLLDDSLANNIAQLLARYQVDASQLEIEITESALMQDPEHALQVLREISQLGVSLAVDDFGTGYSSLAYLRQLPINCLKIDLTFVRHMLDNAQDEIIVNSIVHLAHNLNLTVVAEGVEDAATYQRLAQMGCDIAQGYYMSKPIVAGDVPAWALLWDSKI